MWSPLQVITMAAGKSYFAGSWYPATASECEKEINKFLKEAKVKYTSAIKLKGGIVPHAGWYFSGSIACGVIQALSTDKHPDLLVIFGMHLHPDSPCCIMSGGTWETPFGEIEIEAELAEKLKDKFSFQIETEADFYRDNTIELQLPFIKYFFNKVKILPIGVPPAKSSIEIGKEVVKSAQSLGLSVKIIGSTDLTHYGYSYGFSPKGSGVEAVDWVRNKNDQGFINAVLSMDPVKIIKEAQKNNNACCSGAVAAAIAAARQLGVNKAELAAYALSYDKKPDDSFVGYAGILF